MAKICFKASYLLAELVEGVKVAADAVWKGIFAEVKLHFGRFSLLSSSRSKHFRDPHRACAAGEVTWDLAIVKH